MGRDDDAGAAGHASARDRPSCRRGAAGGIDRRRPKAHTDGTDAKGPGSSPIQAWRPVVGRLRSLPPPSGAALQLRVLVREEGMEAVAESVKATTNLAQSAKHAQPVLSLALLDVGVLDVVMGCSPIGVRMGIEVESILVGKVVVHRVVVQGVGLRRVGVRRV